MDNDKQRPITKPKYKRRKPRIKDGAGRPPKHDASTIPAPIIDLSSVEEHEKIRREALPRRLITYDDVFKLAEIDCTVDEIASCLNVEKSLLYDRFSEAMRKGHENGQKSLKRAMHEKAYKGDTTMMIWLSKQRLGYKERRDDESVNVQFNIQVNEVPK